MSLALVSRRAALLAPWNRNELWRRARAVPSLDLRFAENKSLVDATTGASLVTFTRASSATYVDSQGVIQTASTDVPRFDHNPTTGESLGLLVEEARTNSIRNNTMVGAVAGTPGTLPTNWGQFTNVTGVTREIIGTGVDNGVSYVDIRLSGTPSAAGVFDIQQETAGSIAASNGQTWTLSGYLKLQSGSTTGVSSIRQRIALRDASSEVQAFSTVVAQSVNSLGLQSFSTTGTVTNVATQSILPLFRIELSGVAIDITLRIGLPQLEQGAFATSVIPTTTAAATRSADVASITGSAFSGWYRQDEGTVFCSFARSVLIASGTFANLWALSNNTANERILTYNTGASQGIDAVVTDDGVSQAILLTGAIALNTTQSHALAYQLNNFVAVKTPGVLDADTLGTLPTVDRLYIGSNHAGAGAFGAPIRRLTYWPARLGNEVLQRITQ